MVGLAFQGTCLLDRIEDDSGAGDIMGGNFARCNLGIRICIVALNSKVGEELSEVEFKTIVRRHAQIPWLELSVHLHIFDHPFDRILQALVESTNEKLI